MHSLSRFFLFKLRPSFVFSFLFVNCIIVSDLSLSRFFLFKLRPSFVFSFLFVNCIIVSDLSHIRYYFWKNEFRSFEIFYCNSF